MRWVSDGLDERIIGKILHEQCCASSVFSRIGRQLAVRSRHHQIEHLLFTGSLAERCGHCQLEHLSHNSFT